MRPAPPDEAAVFAVISRRRARAHPDLRARLHPRQLPRLTDAAPSADLGTQVMDSAAILTFIIVAGLVWGGFLVIVTTAIRKESRKTRQG